MISLCRPAESDPSLWTSLRRPFRLWDNVSTMLERVWSRLCRSSNCASEEPYCDAGVFGWVSKGCCWVGGGGGDRKGSSRVFEAELKTMNLLTSKESGVSAVAAVIPK